jgi:hypothetical protein
VLKKCHILLLADLTASSMSMCYLLASRHLLIEKATDFMPIAMNLEEETLTAIPVVAIILAVINGAINTVWPSIFWICIAYPVVASVGQ